MRALSLVFMLQVSLQLQCDKSQFRVSVGGEFILRCSYQVSQFRYSRKYWCRGESRSSCEIKLDSERRAKDASSSQVIDAVQHGLFVKITNLQLHDSDVYWVGIDKMYADIMFGVKVEVADAPVSVPKVWPLTSLLGRPTCLGLPVTVRCHCTAGTSIRYTWYQHGRQEDVLLQTSPLLRLHCGSMNRDSQYYCAASNSLSSKTSHTLFVQVLRPAETNCIYVIETRDQPVYNCDDWWTTSTARTTTMTQLPTEHLGGGNRTLRINNTNNLQQSRKLSQLPFWYRILRWTVPVASLFILWLGIKCVKPKHKKKRGRRRQRVCLGQTHPLAR